MMNLSLQDTILIKVNGGFEKRNLADMYDQNIYPTEEIFLSVVESWFVAGLAIAMPEKKTTEEELADKVAKELLAIENAEDFKQDYKNQVHFADRNLGNYDHVAFPAKSKFDAQNMRQIILRNYNVAEDTVKIELDEEGEFEVAIYDCPIRVFASLQKAFGFKRAGEAVSNTVAKTANGILQATNITMDSVVAPVAKVGISTGAKALKGLFSLGSRVASIAVAEVVRETKNCANDIMNDPHLKEARGECIDGVQKVRRFANSKTNNYRGGRGRIY